MPPNEELLLFQTHQILHPGRQDGGEEMISYKKLGEVLAISRRSD